MAAERPRFLPLESNPDVINKYLVDLGIPKEVHCEDVFGFEPELLDMVPKPVIGVLLLFPVTDNYDNSVKEVVEKLKAEGKDTVPSGVYFMKQKIRNACGTMALLHVLGNKTDVIQADKGIWHDFYERTKDLDPDARSKALDEAKEFHKVHEEAASEGQTAPPSREESVDLHFLAFINKEGTMYEMDGRKPFPLSHGPTTDDKFLADAAEIIKKQFIEKQPDSLQFTVIAMVKA
jgi:ubiquitin carboxyl-terminal hydrolase L3